LPSTNVIVDLNLFRLLQTDLYLLIDACLEHLGVEMDLHSLLDLIICLAHDAMDLHNLLVVVAVELLLEHSLIEMAWIGFYLDY
jgi:hypothetical protein